jgi:hypothetical protein
MYKESLELAIELFRNLSWWKRKRIFYWYKRNNWDVTGAWKECVDIAEKMIDDAGVRTLKS